jgi:hypothetical protein
VLRRIAALPQINGGMNGSARFLLGAPRMPIGKQAHFLVAFWLSFCDPFVSTARPSPGPQDAVSIAHLTESPGG